MQLKVVGSNWGDVSSHSIEVLLTDVASHLILPFREPLSGTIVVAPTPNADDDPITPYRPSQQAPFTILLSARDSFWSQFAYQFSHELCHVLSDYERLGEGPNGWFHEAICELASVFTLRRMAERWRTCPPYPGRTDYAESLDSYADSYLSIEEHRYTGGHDTLRLAVIRRRQPTSRPLPERQERSGCLYPPADLRERTRRVERHPQAA